MYRDQNSLISLDDVERFDSIITSGGLYCVEDSLSGRCVILTFTPTGNEINLQVLERRQSIQSVRQAMIGDIKIMSLVQSLINGNNSIVAMIETATRRGIIREYDQNLRQNYNLPIQNVDEIKIIGSSDNNSYLVAYVQAGRVFLMTLDKSLNIIKEANQVNIFNDIKFSKVEITILSSQLIVVSYIGDQSEVYYNIFKTNELILQGPTHKLKSTNAQQIVQHYVIEFQSKDVYIFWLVPSSGIFKQKLEFDNQPQSLIQVTGNQSFNHTKFKISQSVQYKLLPTDLDLPITYSLKITQVNQNNQPVSTHARFQNFQEGTMNQEGALNITTSVSQLLNSVQLIEINPNNSTDTIKILHQIQLCGLRSELEVKYYYVPQFVYKKSYAVMKILLRQIGTFTVIGLLIFIGDRIIICCKKCKDKRKKKIKPLVKQGFISQLDKKRKKSLTFKKNKILPRLDTAAYPETQGEFQQTQRES